MKVFKKGKALCPLCRLELHDWNIETHPANSDIKQQLKSEPHLSLYKLRKEEEHEERLVEEMTLRVKISVGNLHQLVPSQVLKSTLFLSLCLPSSPLLTSVHPISKTCLLPSIDLYIKGQNSHKWTFFLLPHDSIVDLSKYIRDVTVFLHPTFNPSKIVLSEEPFMFSRVC